MKVINFVLKVIFLVLLFYETYMIAAFNNLGVETPNIQVRFSSLSVSFKAMQLDLFTFIILIAAFCLFFSLWRLNEEGGSNRHITFAILFYCLYQILIIWPLSYFEGIGSVITLGELTLARLGVLLIPFFLWFILPSFKKTENIFHWLNIAAIILVAVGLINYRNGNSLLTNTGQIRLLWGGSVLFFATVFLINFFRKKRKLINYFFIFISLLGAVFANHRSAYVALLLVILIGVWFLNQTRSRIKTAAVSLLVIAGILFIFAQNGLLWQTFSRRLQSISLQDENAQGRFQGWKLAYEHFKYSPINGSLLKNQYYNSIYYNQITPHGFIFEILPTQGIVGLAFYLYILIYSLVIGYKNRADEISLQMFLALLFYVLFATFNATLLNSWSILIMILAVSIILYRNKKLHIHSKTEFK